MPIDAPALYAPWFTEEERRDLEAVPHDDLTGEIYLQRYLLVLVMSRSPSSPLDFELLLEKNRACHLAIRSLISLIYAELEIRKSKTPEWKLFYDAAHLLAAEQLGIVEDAFSPETAEKIRTTNPYWIRYKEMEESFDTDGVGRVSIMRTSPIPTHERRGKPRDGSGSRRRNAAGDLNLLAE